MQPSALSQTRERRKTAMRLTSLGQETQLRVLGTLSASLYTGSVPTRTHKLPPTTESSRPRLVTSYRVTIHLRHQLRHTALYYVTNLEYLVIANHLSASGLQLAPHLTHAPSRHPDGRGAGDTQDKSEGIQSMRNGSRNTFSSLEVSEIPEVVRHTVGLTQS